MRTTLTIDDDILALARRLAEVEHISIGQAVSALARRGVDRIGLRASSSDLPVFDVPDDFPACGSAT